MMEKCSFKEKIGFLCGMILKKAAKIDMVHCIAKGNQKSKNPFSSVNIYNTPLFWVVSQFHFTLPSVIFFTTCSLSIWHCAFRVMRNSLAFNAPCTMFKDKVKSFFA